jgi:voltage-gated potassium channel
MQVSNRIRPYDVAILALSAFVLMALAVETFLPITGSVRSILQYADLAVCMVFLSDFVVRLKTATNRRRYMLESGWLDFISSLPTIPALRLGRLARLFRAFKVLRGVRSARNLTQHLAQRRVESTVSIMLVSAFMLVILASIAILQFEGDHSQANIRTPEDAVWWAYATVTTVGYGDRYPVTTEGRLVGAVLMIGGIGVYGVIAGAIAAWFLGPQKQIEQSAQAEPPPMKQDLQ